MHLFRDPAVEATFASFPQSHQPHLLRIRELIFETAEGSDLPCQVNETLKWGEPSYVPVKARVGSAVRLGSFDGDHIAMYFNCQSSLVEGLRATFGDELSYSKNRAVLFPISRPLPDEAIGTCVRRALRYHLDK